MKTDKELLELAAKAAGNEAQWDCLERGMMVLTPDGIDTTTWNPLTDDGDALRLATKLRLDVAVSERNKRTVCVSLKISGINMVSHGNDPDAATRRAIVLTAAELGEAM